MSWRIAGKVTLLVVACLVVTGTKAAVAQQPTRPLLVAADRINSVTPQAVAQQTIRIGTYNAATKGFVWELDEVSPPDYKDAQPLHIAEINSRNVTYEFEIANKPANFKLTLSYPAANGGTVEKVAVISGSTARIDITPPSFAVQTVRITPAGAPVMRIWPRLKSQLGAFVVPYLLVAIVYEPPGAESKATYSTTTTAGTSVSWGFSRSEGFITEPANTDTLMWVFNKVLGIYIQVVGGAVGEKLGGLLSISSAKSDPGDFLKGVFEQMGGVQTSEVQYIIDRTRSSSRTQGHSISITEEESTRIDEAKYPGRGDVFVILEDVVYMYVAYQGKIYMTPVAYRRERGIRASDLATVLPPELAQSYLALDPHFSGQNPGRIRDPRVEVSPRLAGGRTPSAPRLKYVATKTCEVGSEKALEIASTDYQVTAGSQSITQTKLERVTGLVARMTGGEGTTTTSVTYSSTTELYTSTTTAPRVEVACDAGEEFDVDVYFDNVFGTFFTLQGALLGTTAAVAGTAQDAQGRPRPSQPVMLAIGSRRYQVRSDASGNFAFRFASIPTGPGTITTGGQSLRISYLGTPVTGVKIVVGAAAGQATTQPPIRVAPITRPKVKPRTP
jgi:hypothetical protein